MSAVLDRTTARRLLAAALALALTASLGATAEAKKKNTKKFARSVVVNAAIPDFVPGAGPNPVVSEITVPKRFKGGKVGDVDVTGIQTVGLTAGAANDLVVKLTAPNGRTVILFLNLTGVSIGPLTLDDESPISICTDSGMACRDPDATLGQPFAGTANKLFLGDGGTGPLSAFDGVPMRGTWTLRAQDWSGVGETSILSTWGLKIKRQKAGKKKKRKKKGKKKKKG